MYLIFCSTSLMILPRRHSPNCNNFRMRHERSRISRSFNILTTNTTQKNVSPFCKTQIERNMPKIEKWTNERLNTLLLLPNIFSRATVHVIKGYDFICAAFVLCSPCFAVCGRRFKTLQSILALIFLLVKFYFEKNGRLLYKYCIELRKPNTVGQT